MNKDDIIKFWGTLGVVATVLMIGFIVLDDVHDQLEEFDSFCAYKEGMHNYTTYWRSMFGNINSNVYELNCSNKTPFTTIIAT